MLTTFLTNFLDGEGESMASTAAFLALGESMKGRILFSTALLPARGGEERLPVTAVGCSSDIE
jgi:hypothetical protein